MEGRQDGSTRTPSLARDEILVCLFHPTRLDVAVARSVAASGCAWED